MAMPITAPRYTVADLERFPDDHQRYELVDGVLLVTPPPEHAHQGVLGRLDAILQAAVGEPGPARVVSPGAIYRDPFTYLEPDLLVIPARFPLRTGWRDITEHWLAVEVFSPSSRIYDREFKRGAYLALGVREVWLVDLDARTVETSVLGDEARIVTALAHDVVRWRPPGVDREIVVDLAALFRGLVTLAVFAS